MYRADLLLLCLTLRCSKPSVVLPLVLIREQMLCLHCARCRCSADLFATACSCEDCEAALASNGYSCTEIISRTVPCALELLSSILNLRLVGLGTFMQVQQYAFPLSCEAPNSMIHLFAVLGCPQALGNDHVQHWVALSAC